MHGGISNVCEEVRDYVAKKNVALLYADEAAGLSVPVKRLGLLIIDIIC